MSGKKDKKHFFRNGDSDAPQKAAASSAAQDNPETIGESIASAMGDVAGAAGNFAQSAMENVADAASDAVDALTRAGVLEEQNKALSNELKEVRQKLLYLEAEYQNYRKRVAKDLADARNIGTDNAVHPFLQIYDYLGMAQTAMEKSDNIPAIKAGLTMIFGEYQKAFDELDVRRIDMVGKSFDPHTAEAVAYEPSEQVSEGVVIRQNSAGYRIGERLLRAARVVVSSGKAPAAKEEASSSEENADKSEQAN
ncbi:MAG: nucleotide exchange factor GrpE [Victivallaceae bacterium]|nr:nucleotide exchange factor GrpE [Victivallaceae bacterium]